MMIMFNKCKFAMTAAAFLAVASCAGSTAQLEANGETPSQQEVANIATTSYENTFRRAPQNLQIRHVKYTEIFFNEQELIACVSTTESEQGDVYNSAGEVIITAGTSYTKDYIMLMRRYEAGWGSGIFRPVSGGKIGSADIKDICPGR